MPPQAGMSTTTNSPAHRKPSVVKHPDLDTPSVSLREYMNAMFGAVHERIDALLHRVEALEKRVEALEKKVDSLIEQVGKIKAEIRSEIRWIMGIMLAILLSVNVPLQLYIISQLP